MRKLIGLLLLLLISFSLTSVSVAHAGAAIDRRGARSLWETAPLPPPTPTRTADETVVAHLDEPFTLPLHQWVIIKDTPEPFGLQLTGVVSDSRCPATVNCVVAGQAEFMLLLRMGTVVSPKQFTIGSYPTNDQNKVRYAGYIVELTDVQPPAPPPDQQLQPGDYAVTLIVRADAVATPAPTTVPTITPTAQDDQEMGYPALNQPFELAVGETGDVRDADFQVTLRSVTEDSGCLTESDCSLMLAEGTLVLQQGDQREVLTFNVSFTPEQPFSYDFASYVVQLVHIEKGRDGQHLATFVVEKPTPTVVIPVPQRVDRCPRFSRFDAAALLQEEVAPAAIANLVFGPFAPDATEVQGMCGYVTTTFRDARLIDEATPYLASEVAADRAVAGAVVEEDNLPYLLQLAHLLAAAAGETDSNVLLRLQTELTAGFSENLISDLTTLAEVNPAFTVSPIHGIGDEGVWLWQQLADGYFAFLITRTDRHFSIVMALLDPAVDELTVLDYAVLLVRRLAPEVSSQTPPTPVSTPEAPPPQTLGDCDLLTVSDAATILGEAVHEPVMVEGQDGSCLYLPRREQALTSEEAAHAQLEYGVITQLIMGGAVVDQLLSLAAELQADNPTANEATFAMIQSSLLASDTQGALALLPQLADGANTWIVEAIPTLDEDTIWIWFTEEDQTYSAVFALGDTGVMQGIIASLPADRDQDGVREALIAAASHWEK